MSILEDMVFEDMVFTDIISKASDVSNMVRIVSQELFNN